MEYWIHVKSHQGVRSPMHNLARSTWQLLHSIKRQTRKGTEKVIECCANSCKTLRKVLKNFRWQIQQETHGKGTSKRQSYRNRVLKYLSIPNFVRIRQSLCDSNCLNATKILVRFCFCKTRPSTKRSELRKLSNIITEDNIIRNGTFKLIV